ncbi:hypothetical protein JOB18_039107 [Solea senegalensis]|uniref:Uncharacterized protein n=1 Tax=Solea senegalensis TaxID=28829 RepID=A0AAV6QPB4_SOLSE|nr:hypothetical protein JOB18_039107 [Solea senegalensis]
MDDDYDRGIACPDCPVNSSEDGECPVPDVHVLDPTAFIFIIALAASEDKDGSRRDVLDDFAEA